MYFIQGFKLLQNPQVDQCPQKCNYCPVPSPGSRFHVERFPNRTPVPTGLWTRGEPGQVYCQTLAPCSSARIGATSCQSQQPTHFSTCSSWRLLTCWVPQSLLLLSVDMLWHTELSLNSEEIWAHRSGPGLLCPVRGAELASTAGEADTSAFPNQRDLAGGESRSEWHEDLRGWVSREGKKLKNHNSLAVKRLVNPILPRERLLCFQTRWIQKKERVWKEGRCLGEGSRSLLPAACEKKMWRVSVVDVPHGIMWIFFVACSVVTWGFSLKCKDSRWWFKLLDPTYLYKIDFCLMLMFSWLILYNLRIKKASREIKGFNLRS